MLGVPQSIVFLTKDLFILQVSATMKIDIDAVPKIIETMYQRFFIKNEKFDFDKRWFPFLDFYVKHRENLFKDD